MAIIRHVVEYSNARVRGNVILGVKIVGLQSRNGYRYLASALDAAKALYEDTSVYVLHPDSREKRRGSRQLDAHFGHLRNIFAAPDGLFGDLHVKQSHPMAGLILESDGKQFGLSHNAVVEMNTDETEVTKIVSVNSVDLVDNPATTTNLFEEENMDLAELVAANEALATRLAAVEGTLTGVLEAVTKKPEPSAKPEPLAKPDRIAVLEKITDGDGEPDKPAPIGNSYDDFLDTLRGFSTTNTKGAQV